MQIGETLNTIRELGGKHTVLLSTHILTEVEKVCERVIIIDKGRIELDETMKSIEGREPTYVMEVRGPQETVRKFLQEQPELAKVDVRAMDGDLSTFEVHTRGGKDLREELARRIAARGWGIRKLDVRRASLDELFSKVVLRRREAVALPAA